MSDFDVKERCFEQDIEGYLVTSGGYAKGDPPFFYIELQCCGKLVGDSVTYSSKNHFYLT